MHSHVVDPVRNCSQVQHCGMGNNQKMQRAEAKVEEELKATWAEG